VKDNAVEFVVVEKRINAAMARWIAAEREFDAAKEELRRAHDARVRLIEGTK